MCVWQHDKHNHFSSEKTLLSAYEGLAVTEPLTQGRSINYIANTYS